MKLFKDLYTYPWQDPYENNCNTYVITGKKTVLIDPGHRRFLESLFARMEEDRISADTIDLLIVTHSHPDHLEGAEAFQDRGLKVAMSRGEVNYLQGSGKYLYEMMGQRVPRIRFDFYLKEGELQVEDKAFEIYETPGHSPGSLSIYWPKRKALFTGDVIFSGGIGRTDFPEGDPDVLARSIERLSRLDIEILLPGHGEIIMGKAEVLENFEVIRQSFFGYL